MRIIEINSGKDCRQTQHFHVGCYAFLKIKKNCTVTYRCFVWPPINVN